MAKLQPIGDNIVVAPMDENESTTQSGIVLPATVSKEKPQRGKVVTLGTAKLKDGSSYEFTVKEGDDVIYNKYTPAEVEVDGETFLIMSESDVLAIVK